jgi:Protein of unknown function (DUF2971)
MKLYKYIPPQLWEKILPPKQIRFTQCSLLNDPFELQPFYESPAEDAGFRRNIHNISQEEVDEIAETQLTQAYLSFPAEFREMFPFDLFKNLARIDKQVAIESAIPFLDALMPEMGHALYLNFNKLLGILSLTEKFDDLLMWAHYAKNHEGLVLEFDCEHPFFNQKISDNDEFRHLRKIVYSKERPNIQIMTEEDAVGIFLTKSGDWEYEQEWRMLLPLENAEEQYEFQGQLIHLFAFPSECVTSVIFGCRMRTETKAEITDFLNSTGEYSHVNKFDSRLNNREFRLNMILAEV